MAKSGKHKKLRRQEKAKTQLKGSLKKLGKAQNVIEPKLQTKKIVLREQLSTAAEGEVTTRRRQSIHDVLSSLNHHNVNTKTEALSGLYELITTEHEVLSLHLGKIIDKLAQLTSDIESSVRKETLRVAEVVFTQIPEDQIQPFWNLVLTHLKCTLTNLNPSIRQSCLSFVMLLITCCPTLMSSSKNTILPPVLNLISSTPSSTSSGTSRLRVDIGDKTTEIKERIRVLSLIASCLDLHDATPWNADETQEDPVQTHFIFDQGLSSVHANLYYPFGYFDARLKNVTNPLSVIDSDVGITDSFHGDTKENESASWDQSFLAKFIRSCFPILCETWIEAAPSLKSFFPSKKSEKTNQGKKRQAEIEEDEAVLNLSHVNKSAAEVLQCVVEVMVHLIIHNKKQQDSRRILNSTSPHDSSFFKRDRIQVEKNVTQDVDDNSVVNETLIRELRKTYGQDLQKYFFQAFPFYSVHDNQKQMVITVNLQLFHIAASLRLVDHQLMDKFDTYINGLMKKDTIDAEQVSLVLESLGLIKIPKISVLATKFIIFALQQKYQHIVFGFLNRILSFQATLDDTKFADSIDWENLVPHLVKDFMTDESNANQSSFVPVFTLIAMRKHVDMGPLLENSRERWKELLVSSKSGAYCESIIRLFYYANSLHLLQDVSSSTPTVAPTVNVLVDYINSLTKTLS